MVNSSPLTEQKPFEAALTQQLHATNKVSAGGAQLAPEKSTTFFTYKSACLEKEHHLNEISLTLGSKCIIHLDIVSYDHMHIKIIHFIYPF